MNGRMFQSQQVAVNQATGTGTLVAAVAGKAIRVVAAYLIGSGTTAGPWNFAGSVSGKATGPANTAGIPIVLPYNPDGWFDTAPGDALNIVVGGTTYNYAGEINYVQV